MSDQFEEIDYEGKVNLGIWKQLLGHARAHRPLMVALGAFMVLVAVIDGIFPQLTRYAVDTLLPRLQAAAAAQPAAADGAAGGLAAFAAALADPTTGLGWFILGYAALGAFQGFNVWFLIVLAGLIEVRLCHDLRGLAFRRLQELSFSWYDRTPAGWIMSRMTSDTMRLGEVIAWGLVDFVWGAAMILVIIGFMLAMDWRLALVTLVILPPLLLATGWFQKRLLGAQRQARKANSKISGAINEGLQGARTSKTLVIEADNCRDFGELAGTLRASSIRAAKLSALYMPVVLFLCTIGAALALGFGGKWLIGGFISYGVLVAFLAYAVQFFDPAREVARVLGELQGAQASAERLLGLIATEPEIQDRPEVLAKYGDALHPRHENWEKIKGEVVFDSVDFRYGTGNWVLKDFRLEIPAGQNLAIVGETGSGKSSLVNLLCRFYEPVAGRILIDGEDYRERSQHWLHSRLGYVLQTPQLFSGTIRENIRYGRLDASDAEVEAAAVQANAMGFVSGLADGLETKVGEGGVLLSTGQKQLISLARALVADPAIMILDEATSSIDTETEALIQEAVNRMLAGRTSVVIAHRLSTIRNADRIIVLDHGRIIEDGTHQALMAANGRYRALYTRQFLDEEALVEAAGA
jgi:ATP-binding cassette subfamily B protein